MAESRESARGPMFGDGRFLHADGRARFIALDAAAAARTRRRANIRWCSTPAACAITGTP